MASMRQNVDYVKRTIDSAVNVAVMDANGNLATLKVLQHIDGGNIMTSVEQIKKNGTAVKYSSDGIIHKRSTYTYVDGKINASSVKNKYAFADYYTKYDSRPIDSNGRFSNAFPTAF